MFALLLACAEPKAECPDGEMLLEGTCVPANCVAPTGTEVSAGEGTLEDAIEAAAPGDTLALGSGTFIERGQRIEVDGLTITGWCPALTRIESDFYSAAFEVEEVASFSLGGVALVGGAPGITAESTGGLALALERVEIEGAGTAGILLAGAVTLTGTDVSVLDSRPAGDGSLGRGLSLQAGVTASLTGGAVRGNREAGVFADASVVRLTNVEVADTEPSESGWFGRGVHVQSGSTLVGEELRVSGSRDAAVALLGSTGSLVGGELSGTTLAPFSDGSGEGGEGLVLMRGEGDVPALFTIDGTSFANNARAGIFVDGVEATVDAGAVDGNEYSFVVQNDGSLGGTETCEVGADQEDRSVETGLDPLPIYDEPME